MSYGNLLGVTFDFESTFKDTPTGFSDLPQEIINFIVDLVAHSESFHAKNTALHTLNSASRSFRARAQLALFEDVHFIVDFGASTRAQNLRRILEGTPWLVDHILSFKVIIKEPKYLMELMDPSLNMAKAGAPARMFVKAAKNLVMELGTLSKEHFLWLFHTMASSAQVVNFSLVGASGEEKDVNWSSLSDYSQSLLLSIRSSTRLKSLELANISGLTNRMIIGTTNHQSGLTIQQDSLPIKNLVIRRCRLETSSTVVFDIPSIAVPFRHLNALDITEFPASDADILGEFRSTLDMDLNGASQSFRFPALTKLSTGLNLDSTRATQSVKDLISSCRKTIKFLKIRISTPKRDPSSTDLSLPRMPVLQELWIGIKARNADITQPFLKLVARSLLSASASASAKSKLSAVQTIGLDLEIETANGREIQAAFGWENLDKVMVDQGAFPHLRNVVIALRIDRLHRHGYGMDWSDSKTFDAKNVLPLTLLSGRIIVDVRDMTPDESNF